MAGENNNELFSLKLSQEGISHLHQFARIIKIYIIIGIVFVFLSFANEVFIILELRRMPDDLLLAIYFRLYPILVLIGIIIFIFQLVYFRRLSTLMQKAIENTDEISFNNAFGSLNKIAWAVMSNLILALVYSILNIAVALRHVF